VLKRVRAPRLESLFIAAFVLLGFRLGALPISDNSMFTHLRTGLDMVARGAIPRTDPYSYTAKGATWVVQSWIPEWTYGWAHRLGGFHLVVLEQAVLIALVAWLTARLARTGSPLRTALSVGLAVLIGAPYWSPRPLLFGLICMALTVTIVERGRSPWLLVPVVWLWVNSHGSFPLGLLWLATRALGERLDRRVWPREIVDYVWAFLGSLLVAVINPLGARLLLFPLTVLHRGAAFEHIVEWQSPNFHMGGNRVALVALAVVVVLMFRARLTWRDAVPSMVFLVLSLYAVRNLPILAIVVAPVLARILKRPEGTPVKTRPQRETMNLAVAATLAAAFVVFGVLALSAAPLDFVPYPQAAVNFLDQSHLLQPPNRLAHQDAVGNFLTLRFGRKVPIFIDDRVDMFPLRVSEDYVKLLSGSPSSLSVLDHYGVDVVLWEASRALPAQLRLSGRWQEVFTDGTWVVYRRVPSSGS
jgi:hypothetical protein